VNVRGIVWMGVQSERFGEMRGFFEALLGARPGVDDEGFAVWRLPGGELVELFAEGRKPTFGSAPVVGFLVDDLDAAREVAAAARGEVVSTYGPNEDGYAALHVRAPDGNVFELVVDPAAGTR
jgi:catechol 2,3-dioxygenase-like lactoylglutathione lyase family enzyme